MYHHRERIEKRFGMDPLGRDFAACASWIPDAGPLCVGHVLFNLESGCTARIVSHEMTHAAIYWFNGTLNGYDWDEIPDKKEAEEEFCYLQGDLVSAFYWRYWELSPWNGER